MVRRMRRSPEGRRGPRFEGTAFLRVRDVVRPEWRSSFHKRNIGSTTEQERCENERGEERNEEMPSGPGGQQEGANPSNQSTLSLLFPPEGIKDDQASLLRLQVRETTPGRLCR